MKTLVAALLGLSLCLPLQAADVTLKVATLAPDGTSWMKTFRAAAKAVEQRSSGRVKMRFYPGGVMGDDKSTLDKIRIGQLHGAALGAGGLSLIHFDTQVYSVPFAFTDYAQVDRVRAEMDAQLLDKLRTAGFVSHGLTEGGFAYMMADQRITTLETVRSRKVWLPEGDQISRVALEAMGVAPVSLPMTDVLTGLQTGLINSISAPPSATIALQWHTRVKHLTDVPLLYTYGTIAFSDKALSKLESQDQQILAEEFAKALQQLNRETRADNEKAFKALKNQGIRIDQAETAEIARWRETVNQAIAGMTNPAFSPDWLQRFQALAITARGD